ncbi:MAG TPA: ABC transporter ATP-binding protein [Nitrospiria bacterium]|nr:ABC transporter ATP-binding protein [Nitrospiria bacterium]
MRPLLRVLRYLRPYRTTASLTLGAAVLITLVELAPPWLIKTIIDGVIRGGHLDWLPWLALGLAAAYLVKSLLTLGRIRLNNRLEQRVIYDMRQDVYRALQRQSITYYENRSTGELMSRVVSDVNNLESLFIDGIEAGVIACFTLAGILTVLLLLSWKLALIALLPIPLLVSGGLFFTTKSRPYFKRIHEESARLNALIQDHFSGIRETMGFNQQGYELGRFSALNRAFCRANLQAMRLWSLYSPGMVFLASWGTVMTLWFGAHAVRDGEITLGTLVAFLGYLALFYTPINQIHTINRMAQHALAAGARVFEILDERPAVVDLPDARDPRVRSEGTIRFEEVSFAYRPGLEVIHDASFEARAGERIALVGPSGAGKSTLIKLLMRYHDVSAGRITLDGRDIRGLTLHYLREQIGIVHQEPFLFNGTVRDNILYGKSGMLEARAARWVAPSALESNGAGIFDADLIGAEMPEADMIDAAKGARAHEFIMQLPEGYDTWVGERGVKLSVGQKQRIAIARALLKDPPIIVFDEATSNIDIETEVKIREALDLLTRDRTTLIIAHRLSSLRNADRVLVIVDGRIAEQGTHDSLMASKGAYASLYDAQFVI